MSPALAGAVLGGLGVAFGAFGAHALSARLDDRRRTIFETGVRYQLVHAVALLAVGGLALDQDTRSTVGALLLVGTLLFSGSLYGLALGGPRWLGPVTPLGGLLLVAGWVALAVGAAG